MTDMNKKQRVEQEMKIFLSRFSIVHQDNNSYCFFDKEKNQKSKEFACMLDGFILLDDLLTRKIITSTQKLNFTTLLVRLSIPHIIVKETDKRKSILSRWDRVNSYLGKALEIKPRKPRNPYSL